MMIGAMIALFSLSSPAFSEQGSIPYQYTCKGQDISPELQWQGAPAQTKSFALTVADPDAPSGAFTHWIIYNIPATANSLPPSIPQKPILDQKVFQGINDFKEVGYRGPCPPARKTHSYIFTLYALDTLLSLPPACSYLELQKEIKGHILDETHLTGFFSK